MVKKTRRKEDATKRVFRFTLSNRGLSILQQRKKIKKEPKFIETDKIVNLETLLSEKVYLHYKEHVKNPIPKASFYALIKRYFKQLADHLLENEAGVFIKNFGYFCIIRHTKKRVVCNYRYIYTTGHTYYATFIPIRKDTALQQWTMDRTFSKGFVTKKMASRLKRGKKYKTAYIVLQNLYGRTEAYVRERDDNNK